MENIRKMQGLVNKSHEEEEEHKRQLLELLQGINDKLEIIIENQNKPNE